MRELNLDSIPKPKACPLMGGEPCKKDGCAAWVEIEFWNRENENDCAIVRAASSVIQIEIGGLSTC